MQQGMSSPLYLDWSFWAVVVATIAIILSQLPPIYGLLRRAKLTMETHYRIRINHRIGSPIIQLYVILTNEGGRSVRINGITIALCRDGKNIVTLPAQGYYVEPSDQNPVLFAGFRLKSKDEWAHSVNFFNILSRSDEKRFKDAETALIVDISKKKLIPENQNLNIEADPQYVQAVERLFDENYIWQPGEYELDITVQASDCKANMHQKYRFTLFESDSYDLSKVRADFKYGDGVYWDSGNHTGVFVQIIKT